MADKLPFQDGTASIGNFLSQIAKATAGQATADMQLAEKVKVEQQAVADSAAQYSQHAKSAYDEFQHLEEARKEADAMAGGNLFERISLIGKQTLNPRDYTREGREKQVGELSQGLAFVGQMHNVEVTAAEARVNAAKAQNAIDSLNANAGLVAIQRQVEGLEFAKRGVTAMEEFKQTALSQIDLPTMQTALTGPVDKSGMITLNGIGFKPVELQEQVKKTQTRQQLAMLTPQATDPEFRTKIAVAHSMQLATMNRVELNQLKANGYRMPDGTQVEPGIWDAEYARKVDMDAREFQTKQNELILQNQVPAMLQESGAVLTATQKYATPGTALYAARQKFNLVMGSVAQIAGSDQTPEGKMMQVTALTQANQEYQAALQLEAKRKAGGNEKVQSIYYKQMTGQQVAPEEIGDVMRESYVGMKAMGDLLPREMTEKVRANADQILQAKRVQQAQAANSFNSDSAKVPDKELREQAFNEAYDSLRQSIGVDAVNKVEYDMSQRLDHPAIKAGMTPIELKALGDQAKVQAIKATMDQNQLTEGEMADLMSNRLPARFKGKEQEAGFIMQNLNANITAAQYTLLDAQKKGLGGAVADWYQVEMPKAVDSLSQNIDPMTRDMAGGYMAQQVDNQRNNWLMANQTAYQKAAETLINTASGVTRPENSWLILLNSSTRLQASEKKAVYQGVILPALQAARAQNMNDEETAKHVLATLNQVKADDPILGSAVKNVQRELPELMQSFDSVWRSAIPLMVRGAGGMSQLPSSSNDMSASSALVDSMDWLKPNRTSWPQ